MPDDMGILRTNVEIASHAHPETRALLRQVLVDTGAELSWAPAVVLERLGIVIARRRSRSPRVIARRRSRRSNLTLSAAKGSHLTSDHPIHLAGCVSTTSISPRIAAMPFCTPG